MPKQGDGSDPLIIRCPADGRFLDRVFEHEGRSRHQQNCRHCGHDVYYTLNGMTVETIQAVQPARINARATRQMDSRRLSVQ